MFNSCSVFQRLDKFRHVLHWDLHITPGRIAPAVDGGQHDLINTPPCHLDSVHLEVSVAACETGLHVARPVKLNGFHGFGFVTLAGLVRAAGGNDPPVCCTVRRLIPRSSTFSPQQ